MMFTDVPSPVDFHDLQQARAWVENTVAARPWRSAFFDAFVDALNQHFRRSFSVLELGSGPGHLAGHVLERCTVAQYRAIDFSAAMHALAREHLGAAAERVLFVEKDFRSPHWFAGLAPVDAIVTMQAAHEVRHKARQPGFLAQVRRVIAEGGLFLFCDHYAEPGTGKNPELFLTKREQADTLVRAGFQDVRMLLDFGGIALHRAVPLTVTPRASRTIDPHANRERGGFIGRCRN
ncbi:MAG: class I SAM-dependent methyltransferase [Betaproteobacteria bacterium]|nr:class I SAM-dependent methyltransferase [Betaproteobacteria bacterium]